MLRKKILSIALILLAVSVTAQDKECLNCHSSQGENASKEVLVDLNVLESSVHQKLFCIECHITIKSNEDHKGVNEVDCGSCHKQENIKYLESPHMNGRTEGIENLPTCITCHGGHNIISVDNQYSKTNHKNSVALCIGCHEDEELKSQSVVLPEPKMIKAYENSVHGIALLKEGNNEAPSCIDCHGSHSFLPSDDVDSPLYKSVIAETCGSCHNDILENYQTSIHGIALEKGILESPTCTDCHGEHNIKAHIEPDSKVFATNVPKTCSECHTSEKIVGKYGLKANRIETFKESFHGIAVELGESRAANCASCHGVHNIYKQDNPKSLIHKSNIVKTCGNCHEDLPEDFAKGQIHTSADDESSGGKFLVRQFYILFISLIVIGFILYRILEYKRRNKRVE